MSVQAALYYESLPNGRVLCTLCPHDCKIAPGHRGACGVRVNHDGRLYTLVGDRVVACDVDPVEKKPLFHFLPGSRAYSIATVGCNLRCLFCQNWVISQWPKLRHLEAGSQGAAEEANPEPPSDHPGEVVCPDLAAQPDETALGTRVTPSELVAEAARSGSASIAYTYTEPTIFFELALATARAASEAGLGNIFVTNGFIAPAPLREIAPYLNAANIELRSFRDGFYKRVCGARLQPILEAIRLYKQLGVWIELTTLIIPGLNDDETELREMASFIRTDLGESVPWHLSRFYPAYKMADVEATPLATLRRAREIGREAGLRYVYVGNAPEEEGGEDTVCPFCGDRVIRRRGVGLVENRLRAGRCPNCAGFIEGRWAIAA
jgi:pyruvate formate lyase activating enzyme